MPEIRALGRLRQEDGEFQVKAGVLFIRLYPAATWVLVGDTPSAGPSALTHQYQRGSGLTPAGTVPLL